jgi:acyl-CoA synthetase (AMP-forming)/AMP-acid ligase II
MIVLFCKVRDPIPTIMCIWAKYTLLAQHPIVKDYDLSHVKFCASGAAPLSREVSQQFARVFPNCCIGQGYGEYLFLEPSVCNGPLMITFPILFFEQKV